VPRILPKAPIIEYLQTLRADDASGSGEAPDREDGSGGGSRQGIRHRKVRWIWIAVFTAIAGLIIFVAASRASGEESRAAPQTEAVPNASPPRTELESAGAVDSKPSYDEQSEQGTESMADDDDESTAAETGVDTESADSETGDVPRVTDENQEAHSAASSVPSKKASETESQGARAHAADPTPPRAPIESDPRTPRSSPAQRSSGPRNSERPDSAESDARPADPNAATRERPRPAEPKRTDATTSRDTLAVDPLGDSARHQGWSESESGPSNVVLQIFRFLAALILIGGAVILVLFLVRAFGASRGFRVIPHRMEIGGKAPASLVLHRPRNGIRNRMLSMWARLRAKLRRARLTALAASTAGAPLAPSARVSWQARIEVLADLNDSPYAVPRLPASTWSLGLETASGRVRPRNEDACLGFEIEGDRVLILADGCGGEPDGERAARIATLSSAMSILRDYSGGTTLRPSREEFALRALVAASVRLEESARARNTRSGLRTTLIVAVAGNGELGWAHIGDGGGVVVRESEITPFVEPQKGLAPNEISASLGPTLIGSPRHGRLPLEPGDIVIAGTDGIFDRVEDLFFDQIVGALHRMGGDLQSGVARVLAELVAMEDESGIVSFDDNVTLGIIGTSHPARRRGQPASGAVDAHSTNAANPSLPTAPAPLDPAPACGLSDSDEKGRGERRAAAHRTAPRAGPTRQKAQKSPRSPELVDPDALERRRDSKRRDGRPDEPGVAVAETGRTRSPHHDATESSAHRPQEGAEGGDARDATDLGPPSH
jgi:serine/threonine protein phosphatase PrpC